MGLVFLTGQHKMEIVRNGQKRRFLLVEDDMALSAVYRSRLEIE